MKYAFILLVMLCAPLYAADQGSRGREYETLEIALGAMAYGASLKHGFMVEKNKSGKTTKFIEAVLRADDRRIEATVSRVFAKYLTAEEIENLRAFYTSETGKTLIDQQTKDLTNPNPILNLSMAQRLKARAFTVSPAARSFMRVSGSPEVLAEVGKALERELLK